MPALLDFVRLFIREHELVRSAGDATRVVAAVSGGSDSVALAHLLHALDARGILRLAGIAHFNHQLRAAAGDDERFVAGVADALRVPFFSDHADVARRARAEHRSIEDAARTARHEFFVRATRHLAADVIALGHTRDDQAETVLLRLTRGAGLRGLAGMHARHGGVIRPLLGCRRAELRGWLTGQHLAFVDDESNLDVSIPRNRIRAELLPLLESRFNNGIVDVLADEATLASEAWDWMASAAQPLAPGAGQQADEPSVRREFDIATLQEAPLALRRLAVWEAMNAVSGGRTIGFGHVEAALRLMQTGGSIDAPGQRVDRVGVRLVLTGRPAETTGRWRPGQANPANFFRYPLSIPGETALPEARCVVSVEIATRATACNGPDGATVAVVRNDLFRGFLEVRSRRPGDWFSPVGLGGKKKLQDFFVDRKVARGQRDAVPLVVDASDRIVWVAGYGIDEAFRVTDPAQGVLILTLKALGGSA